MKRSMRTVLDRLNRPSRRSTYRRLQSDRQQIRLAVLEAGDWDDDIVIQLRTESLSGTTIPKFEALSYAWGHDVCAQEVNISGSHFRLSSNLDCALRHLRLTDRKRLLWVDQICINQEDLEERGSQVRLMGTIYSAARVVLIWLGPADNDTADVMAFMRGERRLKTWSIANHESLIRICQRPWFSRVWVTQELVLAKAEPMVHLGHDIWPWRNFSVFIRHTNDHNMHNRFLEVAPRGSDLDFRFWNAAKRIIALQEMRNARSFATFPDFLANTDEFDATNARDKVYGILGMGVSSQSGARIVPDYIKPIKDIFQETVYQVILEEPWTLYRRLPLHPLRKSHAPQATVVADLPSWTMDLTITSQYPDTGHFYNRPKCLISPGIFTTISQTNQKGLASLARLSPPSCLETVGKHIGTISSTSRDLLLDTDDVLQPPGTVPLSIHVLRKIYKEMIEPSGISRQALLRTLIAGFEEKWHGILVDWEFQAAFDALLGEDDVEEIASSTSAIQKTVLCEVAGTAHNLILFVTREGGLGLAYHPNALDGIRPGDEVVGLFGANIPFVLRKLYGSGKDVYNMLNVAFVHDHICRHLSLQNSPPGTTEEEVRNNLDKYGLRSYEIV